jgi:hypothetical protein
VIKKSEEKKPSKKGKKQKIKKPPLSNKDRIEKKSGKK